MGKNMAERDSISLQLCVGVTGHRNLPDPAAVEATVKKVIDIEIGRLCSQLAAGETLPPISPAPPGIHLRVLSPLAEGADRLVARVILSYPGAELEVVLPLLLEDYLQDFESEESKQEFEGLFSLCKHPVFLTTELIERQRSDPERQAELRRDAYLRAGQYVVDHCDLLVALWDGEPSRGRGGTADIVQYAWEKNRRIIRVWGGVFGILNRGSDSGHAPHKLLPID